MSPHKEKSQITGQYGQKIDNAIKTENIRTGFMNDPNSNAIFKTKNKGNAPFQNLQQTEIFILDGGYALEHHQNNTQYDNDKKQHIE